MKIGFIGLGAMGAPMARHLSKEHHVIVWNRTREKAERHAREHGSTLANDIADIAQADVVITMLPTSIEVDEIVDRLLPHLREGMLWIDATSGDPNVSRETAKRLAAKGVAFVDAPVTGATVGAENATLTIMIGGDATDFERARAVLRLCGEARAQPAAIHRRAQRARSERRLHRSGEDHRPMEQHGVDMKKSIVLLILLAACKQTETTNETTTTMTVTESSATVATVAP